MVNPDRDRVVDLFLSGVAAIETAAGGLSESDWDKPACGSWSATEVARHVLGVSTWYHQWLDRAIDGRVDPPFPADELGVRNDQVLDGLSDRTGEQAAADFASSAREYLQRVQAHWDVPFGYPFGTVTAGLHAGVAATEWHLHAWDLTADETGRHQPADAEGLFLAAAACVTAAEGGVKGRVLGWLAPLGARREPWPALLRRSGRGG